MLFFFFYPTLRLYQVVVVAVSQISPHIILPSIRRRPIWDVKIFPAFALRRGHENQKQFWKLGRRSPFFHLIILHWHAGKSTLLRQKLKYAKIVNSQGNATGIRNFFFIQPDRAIGWDAVVWDEIFFISHRCAHVSRICAAATAKYDRGVEWHCLKLHPANSDIDEWSFCSLLGFFTVCVDGYMNCYCMPSPKSNGSFCKHMPLSACWTTHMLDTVCQPSRLFKLRWMRVRVRVACAIE